MAEKSKNNHLSYFSKASRTMLNLLILLITAIIGCKSAMTHNIKELHQMYMAASIRHDIEKLSAMTHKDIVWQLGPYTLEGKEAALGPNRYDASIGNIIEYNNVVVLDDTVEFELVERNELLSAIGMERIRHYPRFIFKDGLVFRKESWKKSPDIPEMNRRAKPKRDWISENHPEVIQKFFDSDGNFIFNRENGKLAIKMTREWKKLHKQ